MPVVKRDPDELLDELDEAISAAGTLRSRYEEAVARRDEMIVRVHRAGLMGYRRLAQRTKLSVARIQQIVESGARAIEHVAPRAVSSFAHGACPHCGNELALLGQDKVCARCGWSWSGE